MGKGRTRRRMSATPSLRSLWVLAISGPPSLLMCEFIHSTNSLSTGSAGCRWWVSKKKKKKMERRSWCGRVPDQPGTPAALAGPALR